MQGHGGYDVVIAGAGVAGTAAGLHLARAGLRSVLIDPKPFPRVRVGESLDWSAPPLLNRLGLPCGELVAEGTGTYKRRIRVVTRDRERWSERPPSWFGRRPLAFGLTTIHLDRERFDERLYSSARAAGVDFIWERVSGVDLEGGRITGFTTHSGRRLRGSWFIDASGRARVVGRTTGIGERRFGVPKVAVWSQVNLPMSMEGTTLHVDDRPGYLTWAWEIPIAEDRQSVGVVMPTSRFRSSRSAREPLEAFLARELGHIPRFEDLTLDRLEPARALAYHCYVSERVSGPNWMMIGEAAALVDPLTSFGVTAALRHASEAAGAIDEASHGSSRIASSLSDFDRRVRGMAMLYNLGIERLVYQEPPRRAFGIRRAARAYVIVGYGMNSLYTRINPVNHARTKVLGILLRTFELWAGLWIALARWTQGRRHPSP